MEDIDVARHLYSCCYKYRRLVFYTVNSYLLIHRKTEEQGFFP